MKPKKIRPGANEADLEMVKRTVVQNTPNRVCRQCGETKPLELFAKDSSRPCGRRTTCADCRSDYDCKRSYLKRCKVHGITPVVEPFSRRTVVELWGNRCVHCVPGSFESIDHLIPVAAGGTHTLENAQPCCRSCNSTKYHMDDRELIEQFRDSRSYVEVFL